MGISHSSFEDFGIHGRRGDLEYEGKGFQVDTFEILGN
jgi:hypothetical protein